jgi:hypothetical protein
MKNVKNLFDMLETYFELTESSPAVLTRSYEAGYKPNSGLAALEAKIDQALNELVDSVELPASLL